MIFLLLLLHDHIFFPWGFRISKKGLKFSVCAERRGPAGSLAFTPALALAPAVALALLLLRQLLLLLLLFLYSCFCSLFCSLAAALAPPPALAPDPPDAK